MEGEINYSVFLNQHVLLQRYFVLTKIHSLLVFLWQNVFLFFLLHVCLLLLCSQ